MLSRQMHNFFKPFYPAEPMTISAAAEFKQQRHQWLTSFEPGQVQGSALREALGLRDGDAGCEMLWLKNMAGWGYPKGWVGQEDPREQVFRRIDSLFAESLDLWEASYTFSIFGDDTVEYLNIGPQPSHSNPIHEGAHKARRTRDSSHTRTDSVEQPGGVRRWATYPSTYFFNDLLPIYNGTRLLSVSLLTPSTFTSDRHVLWERILRDSIAPKPGNPATPRIREMSHVIIARHLPLLRLHLCRLHRPPFRSLGQVTFSYRKAEDPTWNCLIPTTDPAIV
ncbi:hypothetical protein B0F90DRAFT_797396 [Multifurca ochricompacta]|uniref:PSP proline-rich domain-containing protein n=1 Tax=Multifurca ochricompacta TaxID=376703 RepID=A0AAD4QQI3_9AGAM|nr:hypothetical protein B0F90DRAFT_797396 [Multifurca ochricompacta]